MSRFGSIALLLLLPAWGFAQILGTSVTVTASQTAAPQPDQAVFNISVASGIDKNFGDIVSALQGSGLTAADFVSLYSTTAFTISEVGSQLAPVPQPQLDWAFRLTVPLSKVKDTTAALAALAQSIPQNNSGLSLTFQLFNTQA